MIGVSKQNNLVVAFKKSIPFYLLSLVGILFFLLFKYGPMFGIIIAFKDITPFSSIQDIIREPFVGFKWFIRFFNSYYFLQILWNTIWIRLLIILWGFPLPIILAISLNEVRGTVYKRSIQSISYIPHFFSWVVVAGMAMSLLNVENGLINTLLVKLGREPILFLGSPKHFRGILVVINLWKGTGWGSILYLAAISGISSEMYEAAMIDGAGRFQRIWFITLPSISYIIVFLLIFQIGSLLNAGFELIFLLYSPIVYEVADIIDTYVYRSGLQSMEYSFSTAVGLFKSIVALILLLMSDFIARKLGHKGIF